MNYLRKKAGVDAGWQDAINTIDQFTYNVDPASVSEGLSVEDSGIPGANLNIPLPEMPGSLAPDYPILFNAMAKVDDAKADVRAAYDDAIEAADNAKDWVMANADKVRNNPAVAKAISATENVKDWIKTHQALSALIGIGGLGLGYGLYNWMSDDDEEEEDKD